jgi:glycerophosphoryl diester phosphodiesterase
VKRLRPLPSKRRPLLFAHRGASSLAPENTLAAFRAARDMGCPGIELDIHLCASGELVVIHDFDLGRVGGVPLKIEDTSIVDIRCVDIGAWKGSAFKGERVPTLEELFKEFGDAFYYDIEMKTSSPERTGMEDKLSALIDAYGLAESVCVSSFNPFPLKYFKELRKGVPTAIIWDTEGEDIPWQLRLGLGAPFSGCDYLKPSLRCFKRPRLFWPGAGLGRDIVAWTVDDPAVARSLVQGGVVGIVTNKPQDMGEFFGR